MTSAKKIRWQFVQLAACAHIGAALAGGQLCDRIITCPAHGWKFDVSTSALKAAPAITVPNFQVKVTNGRVLIGLNESTP